MANQYFAQQALPEDEFIISDEATRHHMFNVMRLRNGAEVELVFDNQKCARCKVIQSEEAKLSVIELLERKTEFPVEITIAVGFPKGDKLDFITEKATELGASSIWAAPFERSIVKWNAQKLEKRQAKLEKISKSAAEQSQRLIIPEIQLFEKFPALIERFPEFDAILIAYEESAREGEKSAFIQAFSEHPKKILMIFGPEGGISEKEIEQFKNQGAKLVGLGPRILRAETAPLYALSVISSLLELRN